MARVSRSAEDPCKPEWSDEYEDMPSSHLFDDWSAYERNSKVVRDPGWYRLQGELKKSRCLPRIQGANTEIILEKLRV
jgi:hypothetical protein